MEAVESIKQADWLKELPLPFLSEEEILMIESASVKLTFKKGETIIKQGGQSTHVAFLEKGIVKFNFENESGKNLILAIVSSPKILGGANLFYQNNNLFSIVAVEPCSVTLFEAPVIVQLMKNNALFSFTLLQLTSEMFKKTIVNFVSLASKHKEGRIADIMIHLAENVFHSKTFQLTLTRKELAEFASCSPENVIMTLSRWQKESIIQFTGKVLEILDIEKLMLISKNG
jgi:CRP/FNR family transcriptional regulator, polysaccharide utilization system transcription regulator